MSVWAALLTEAREDRSFYLLGGLLVVLVLARRWPREERRRLLTAGALVLIHLSLLPVVAWLSAHRSPIAREVRLCALIFEAVAAIGLSASLLFLGILQSLGVRAPRILRDVLVAAGSVVAILVVASRLGFNLSGIIATSAVLTAVIGLSLQDTLGNIMAGLALQMDNSVQVRDWIKVGDTIGRVVEIRWRSTKIETRNGETVVLPNSSLVRGPFLVLGRRQGQPERWRRWVWFNIDFRTAPTDVIAAATEALSAAPIDRVATDPPPECVLMDLHESYARYAVRYWLTDIAHDDPTDSVVRTRLYFALKRRGIPLSMPAHAIFLTEESTERKADKLREEQERRLRALALVDFFAHLTDEDRSQLAASLRYAPFARGELMTRQGAEAHWLYLIIQGEASVRVAGPAGGEREAARLCAGNFFGEMSLMTGAPRSATVVALSDVECYRLDKSAFQEIVKVRPELAEKVAEVLATRRVALSAFKENLDQAARDRTLEAAKRDLLGRIRDFFGLESPDRRALG